VDGHEADSALQLHSDQLHDHSLQPAMTVLSDVATSMKWQIVLQGLEITYAKCWTWVDCQIIVSVDQRITLALFLQCIDVQVRPIFSLWFNLLHECHFFFTLWV